MAKERRDRSKRGEEAVRRREEAERRRGEEHREEYSAAAKRAVCGGCGKERRKRDAA